MELIKEFRLFAQHMAENNSKAIIEALEQVVRDFNQQLTEQFGENFKQLNEAVGGLLSWQDNYRTHVERLEQEFKTAVEGVQNSEIALGKIVEHTSAIPDAVSKLDPVLIGIQEQITSLSSHLEAVAGLRDRAIEAFPIIEENLKRVTDELASSVASSVEQTNKALETQRSTFDTLGKGYDELQTQASQAQERFQAEFEKALQGIQSQLNTALQSHGQMIETTANEMQKQISEAWTKTEEAINTQMGALDEQLQKELSRALESMGGNLASISEKLVEDYKSLATTLAGLVRATGQSKQP